MKMKILNNEIINFPKFKNNPCFMYSPYSIFVCNTEGNIIEINDTAKRNFDIDINKHFFFFDIFEEKDVIKNSFTEIKDKKLINLRIKTRIIFSKSYYGNIYEIEMHYIKSKGKIKDYILVFLRSYGEVNEMIDILDMHTNYFYSLINLITDPIFIKDKDKKYIIINKHFENLFGISKEEIINKTDYDIFNKEEAKDYIKSDQYVLSQNLTTSEIQWRKFHNLKSNFNDEIFCFNTIKSPIISDNGQTIGLIGISKDITANQFKILEAKSNIYLFKSIEQAMFIVFESNDMNSSLKNSLKLICESLNLISIAFYTKWQEKKNNFTLNSFYTTNMFKLNIIWKNEVNFKEMDYELKKKLKNEKYINIKKEMLNTINLFFNNLIIDEQKEIILIIFPVIHNKDVKSFLILFSLKSDFPDYFKGEIDIFNKFFEFSISQKKAISIFSYFLYDLIEKKKEELILKEYFWDIELIQQTIDIAFWTENIKNHEMTFSKYFNHLLPIPKNVKCTRKLFLSFMDKNTKRKLIRFYNKINKTYSSKCTIPILQKSGSLKYLSFNGKVFENTLIVVVLDITDQKKLEDELIKNIKELEKAKKLALDASEAKSNFLAFLSHELRNMMTAISGISTILNEKLKGKEEEKLSQIIKKGTNQVLETINDILDFSKLESKNVEIKTNLLSIRSFIDKIEDYYYFIAQEKNLEFFCLIDKNLEDNLILDELRVRQILMNLIGNALKFTENGHVKLLVYKSTSNYISESAIVFEAEDTGVGISSEELLNIFKPFKQGNKEIFAKYGGTGLGLSITKNLVELMKGKISVSSIKGQGTKFIVEIPYKPYYSCEEEDLKNYIENNFESFKEIFALINLPKEKIKKENNILICIEDKFLVEKIISLLNYLKLKYISYDFEIHYHDLIEHNKIRNINKNIIGVIIQENYFNRLGDKFQNIPTIIVNDVNAKSIDFKISIDKPFTYKKLNQVINFFFNINK